MASRRLLVGISVTPVVVAAAGCNEILGLDGDSVLRAAITEPDGGPATVAEGGTGAPVPLQCNGVTIALDDPSHGCGSKTCEACSLPFAGDTKCSPTCAVATCAAGRADCNGRADDGCEADLLASKTCGSCTVACPESVPFCGNDGQSIKCLVRCPDGQATCGQSCVDLKNSVEHCGECGKKCTTSVPNSNPVCTNGQCISECRSGQVLCDPADPGKGCGTLRTFFRDGDGDGFGRPDGAVQGCNAPGPGWVTQGGDCHDENKLVFPGQAEFFAEAYAAPGGGFSYDYDCSKAEEEAPGFVHFTACEPPPYCRGSGYLPNTAGTDGVGNPYCGSKLTASCSSSSASGSASQSYAPIGCFQIAGSGVALRCH